MITAILSLLGSSAFCSMLGGIMALFNRKIDAELKRMEQEHEAKGWTHQLSMRDRDIEHAKVEAAGRRDVAIIEGDTAIEAARFQALAAAQAADRITPDDIKAAGKMGWLLVLAEALSKWVRPVVTVAIGGAAIYVNLLLMEKFVASWPAMTPTQQYEMSIQAFAWITGQASAVFGYWFVSRGSNSPRK